jgi:hypothetical protein
VPHCNIVNLVKIRTVESVIKFLPPRGAAMGSRDLRKLLFVSITVAPVSLLDTPPSLDAASSDKKVKITFTGTGNFATPALSGADNLKLAGQ